MPVSTTVGWIAIAVSIFTWAAWTIPLKLKIIQDLNVDPVISQLYISIAIFISSWVVLAFNKFTFTYFGIISALLWVPGNMFAILAIKMIGVSVANGVWAGLIILVSFVWGAVIFRDPIKNIWLTLLGLVLLCSGILGIALSKPAVAPEEDKHQKIVDEAPTTTDQVAEPTNDTVSEVDASQVDVQVVSTSDPIEPNEVDVKTNTVTEINPEDPVKEEEYGLETPTTKLQKVKHFLKKSQKYLLGLGFCCIIGVVCGSMMVPTRYGPDIGIVYMISFGIGNMVVSIPLTVVYFLIRRQKPNFHFKLGMPAFLVSGALWNIGYAGSVYASLSPLGLTVGFPLTQCTLVVSGLLGIFVFREISGWRPIIQFFASAIFLLLPGCTLLALYGKA